MTRPVAVLALVVAVCTGVDTAVHGWSAPVWAAGFAAQLTLAAVLLVIAYQGSPECRPHTRPPTADITPRRTEGRRR